MPSRQSPGKSGTTRHLPPPLFSPAEWHAIVHELALSPQQARIVELLLRDLRDKQIASHLAISQSTLRTHLARLFSRLHVADRVELILRAVAIGKNATAPALSS